MARHGRSAHRTRPSLEHHALAAPSSAMPLVGLRDARRYRSPEYCRSYTALLGSPAFRTGADLRPAIEIGPMNVWQGTALVSPLRGKIARPPRYRQWPV